MNTANVLDSQRTSWWDRYFNNHENLIDEAYLEHDGRLQLDYRSIENDEPELANSLLTNPRATMHLCSRVVNETRITPDGKKPAYTVQVRNLPKTHLVNPKDVRSEHLNGFLAVRCVIKKATEVYPRLLQGCYECKFCANHEYVDQKDWEFQHEPIACSACEKSGPWSFLDAESVYVDEQKWMLSDDSASVEPGGQPQDIQCIVQGDQVNVAKAGESVIVNGIVVAVPKREGNRKKHMNKLFLLENSVELLESTHSSITWTRSEEQEFKDFAANHNPLLELAGNFATNIHGMNLVKEALVLSITGGVEQVDGQGNRERGDIHILMAGDPGAGKSALMEAVPKFTPRCVFASGEGATAAGLTATVTKSDFGDGSWMLEVGAMGLANGGTFALDEMDKMSKQNMGAMHLGMEQQRLEVHEASVHGTIHTKCNVIAACNPKNGAFDDYESVMSQIDLPKPMFSRFDLIFILKNRQTKDQVEDITDHILGLSEEVRVHLDYDWIRKYIAYARTFNPTLSREAAKAMKSYFVELKVNPNAEGINYRALHSIRRLAQAHARVNLRDQVLMCDAEIAIALFKNWAQEIGFDESTGKLDITPLDGGLKKSVRDAYHVVKETVKAYRDANESWPTEEKIIESLVMGGMDAKKARNSVHEVKEAGDLLQSGEGGLRLAGYSMLS